MSLTIFKDLIEAWNRRRLHNVEHNLREFLRDIVATASLGALLKDLRSVVDQRNRFFYILTLDLMDLDGFDLLEKALERGIGDIMNSFEDQK